MKDYAQNLPKSCLYFSNASGCIIFILTIIFIFKYSYKKLSVVYFMVHIHKGPNIPMNVHVKLSIDFNHSNLSSYLVHPSASLILYPTAYYLVIFPI